MTTIVKHLASSSRISSVDLSNPVFGKECSDHMFTAEYNNGQWNNPQIVPFANIAFSPAMLALHYGQSVFEGMKAFRMQDGRISIFRPERHLMRFNISLERMCMPTISKELFFENFISFFVSLVFSLILLIIFNPPSAFIRSSS